MPAASSRPRLNDTVGSRGRRNGASRPRARAISPSIDSTTGSVCSPSSTPCTYLPPRSHEAAAATRQAAIAKSNASCRPVRERLRRSAWGRTCARSGRRRARGEMCGSDRPEQLLHRVVAEERREQQPDRRQVRDARRRRRAARPGRQARGRACPAACSRGRGSSARRRCRSRARAPSSGTWWPCPAPAPRRFGGRLFMIPAWFGEAKSPIPMPTSSSRRRTRRS